MQCDQLHPTSAGCERTKINSSLPAVAKEIRRRWECGRVLQDGLRSRTSSFCTMTVKLMLERVYKFVHA